MNITIRRFFSLTLFLVLSIAFSNVCEVKAQINESKAYYKTSISKAGELQAFYKAWAEEQMLILEKYDDNSELVYLPNIKINIQLLADNRNVLITNIFKAIENDIRASMNLSKEDNMSASTLAMIINAKIKRYTNESEEEFFKEVFRANKNDYKNYIKYFYDDLNSFDIDSLFEEGLRLQKEKDAASK